jgi:hypothetical protein
VYGQQRWCIKYMGDILEDGFGEMDSSLGEK